MSRLQPRFAAMRAEGRGGLVTFVTAGDPDAARSAEILAGLPGAGADVIEFGMPFTDPMADGPAIERAGGRALGAGQTMKRTLAMVSAFRESDAATPVVLMGYYNPVYAYGPEKFARDAVAAGVDGLIVVDLPPEEAEELAGPAREAGMDMVRLVAPTTTPERLDWLAENASGFIYYISVRGITGARAAALTEIEEGVDRIRGRTELPVAVGFGIRTPEQAAEVARVADAAVVGTAIVERIANELNGGDPVNGTLAYVAALARAVRRTAA